MGVHRTKQEKITAHIHRTQTYQWTAIHSTADEKGTLGRHKTRSHLSQETPSAHAIRTDIFRTAGAIVAIGSIIAIAFRVFGN